MKLHIGYIFDQGLEKVRALGISEWCMNEGTSGLCVHYVDTDTALELGLSEEQSNYWYQKQIKLQEPKNKLRVWWIPQVPMSPFRVEVNSVEEGVKIMNTLADYDIFQFENKVKPDYSNAGGLEMWEDGEWTSWYDETTGEEDPEVYLQEKQETA